MCRAVRKERAPRLNSQTSLAAFRRVDLFLLFAFLTCPGELFPPCPSQSSPRSSPSPSPVPSSLPPPPRPLAPRDTGYSLDQA